MSKLHIITPVKDSLSTTLKTIDCVNNSSIDERFDYTIYNDFSSDETTFELKRASERFNFKLVNLSELTTNPSPNYLLILQIAQQKAIKENAHLIIVESDVEVEPDTIGKLYDFSQTHSDAGLIAAVTVDNEGAINFPYLYAKKYNRGELEIKKRISFCCTLITNKFLMSFDFKNLNPDKSWYDIFISHKSIEIGFKNYLLTSLPVLHKPHSSRPWKLLKYTNPIKYYWRKMLNNKDKI